MGLVSHAASLVNLCIESGEELQHSVERYSLFELSPMNGALYGLQVSSMTISLELSTLCFDFCDLGSESLVVYEICSCLVNVFLISDGLLLLLLC